MCLPLLRSNQCVWIFCPYYAAIFRQIFAIFRQIFAIFRQIFAIFRQIFADLLALHNTEDRIQTTCVYVFGIMLHQNRWS